MNEENIKVVSELLKEIKIDNKILEKLVILSEISGVTIVFIIRFIFKFIRKEIRKNKIKKDEINKTIQQTIKELSDKTNSFDKIKNKYSIDILNMFKDILKNKKVILSFSNEKDSEIIQTFFYDLKTDYGTTFGPIEVICKGDYLELTLDRKIFAKRKYRRKTIKEIDKRIESLKRLEGF